MNQAPRGGEWWKSNGWGIVQGSRLKAQGSGFRVQGSGRPGIRRGRKYTGRVQGSRHRVKGSGYSMQGVGCRIPRHSSGLDHRTFLIKVHIEAGASIYVAVNGPKFAERLKLPERFKYFLA